MTRTDILRAAVEGFRNQQRRLASSISEIEAELNGIVVAANVAEAPKKRMISPEARERMRQAQKKRWAAFYQEQVEGVARAGTKRKIMRAGA